MSRRLDHAHWNSPRPIRSLLKAPRDANEHGVQPVSMMESAPGPEVVQDGARFLYFGGTGYLGLASHPEVIEAGCDALRRFGLHSATSRSLFGTNPPLVEAERRAAEFFGTQDAFYFASGYVSNHILVPCMVGDAEQVLIDDAAHYCIAEAARLTGLPVVPFRSRDAADLSHRLRGLRRVLVLSDAVCPVTGRVAPAREYLSALQDCDSATLLLDDAHGFGVLGPRGRGLLDELGLFEAANGGLGSGLARIGVCGTASKALGGFGGLIPGTFEFVERVRSASHYFDGASAPACPVAAATAKALEIAKRDPCLRQQLAANSARLRHGLRSLGLDVPEGRTAHFGFQVGDAAEMRRIHEGLRSRGILLPYFTAYSGVPSDGLLRVAVFANHTFDQIDRLVSEFRSLL